MSEHEENLVDWDYALKFQKIGEAEEGVLYIAGEASNGLKDHDGENMDMASLKSAFVDYMKNPIIKFMHDKAKQWTGAIGTVVEKHTDSDGKVWKTSFGAKPFLVAKFEKDTMPPWMWNAISKGVYKGFSIGGKAFKKVKGTIYVKSWLETSVVDVPAAKGAFFSVLKSACESGECPHKKAVPIVTDERIIKASDKLGRFIKERTPSPLAGISRAIGGFLKGDVAKKDKMTPEEEAEAKKKKEAEAISKFAAFGEAFLKGGNK